jgi:serine/threonine protein kinase
MAEMSVRVSPEEPEAAELPSTADVAPGANLGRYEILLPVASGGMARVWVARMRGQRGFSKLVAIKTILPHLARSPEFERMFLEEARIAAEIHHPNVCEIYELGEEGNVLYLAMEWVNGDSLFQILRQPISPLVKSDASQSPDETPAANAFEPRIAARILADACAGLHAAHTLEGEDGRPLGIVHQDVSPQNILVTLDGHTKIADFGVAKAFGTAAPNTNVPESFRGKFRYTSPEQISSEPVDRRSDVFALGCVLYEAATGYRAFDAVQDHLVMQQVLECRPVLPSRHNANFPAELEQIIARAMAPHPGQRFASAERMRIALERWLARSGSQVVTQADVALAVRARIGPKLALRKERLKHALASTGEFDAAATRSARVSTPGAMPLPLAVERDVAVSQSYSGIKPLVALRLSDVNGASMSLPSTDRSRVKNAHSSPESLPLPIADESASVVSSIAVQQGQSPYVARFLSFVSPARVLGSRRQAVPFVAALLVTSIVTAGVGMRVLSSVAPDPRDDARSSAYALEAARGQMREPGMIAAEEPPARSVVASAASAARVDVPALAITFRVSPQSARLVVDGNMLAEGARDVPRPLPGRRATVDVRAAGFVSTSVAVDETTPLSVAVALVAIAPKAKTKAVFIRPVSPQPSNATELPANPY